MDIFLLSLLESFYIIFMMNFFKTTLNVAHPMTYIKNKYFYHHVNHVNIPRGMVCKFGRDVSWFIALYFYIRGILEHYYKYNLSKITKGLLVLIFLASLINFNVTMYFIPIFIIELIIALLKN